MIAAPKNPFINKSLNEKHKKRIYTITNDNKIFTIKLNKDDFERTTLLAFNKKIDATKISYMLENHYNQTKDWPETLLNPNSGFFLLSGEIVDDIQLSLLNIKSWDFVEFNNLCMQNLIDYLLISEISINRSDAYNIKGQLVKIADNQIIQCADILNKIYDKS